MHGMHASYAMVAINHDRFVFPVLQVLKASAVLLVLKEPKGFKDLKEFKEPKERRGLKDLVDPKEIGDLKEIVGRLDLKETEVFKGFRAIGGLKEFKEIEGHKESKVPIICICNDR